MVTVTVTVTVIVPYMVAVRVGAEAGPVCHSMCHMIIPKIAFNSGRYNGRSCSSVPRCLPTPRIPVEGMYGVGAVGRAGVGIALGLGLGLGWRGVGLCSAMTKLARRPYLAIGKDEQLARA